jgi:hypothetical protein
VSKLVGSHVGGELKNNSDENIKIVVDVIVVGKDDVSAVILTETELGAINEDTHDIQLERSCSHDEPCIIDSLRHKCFDSFRRSWIGTILRVGFNINKPANLPPFGLPFIDGKDSNVGGTSTRTKPGLLSGNDMFSASGTCSFIAINCRN